MAVDSIFINIPESSPSGSRRSSCSRLPVGRARGSGAGGSSPCWSLGQTSSGTGSYNKNATIRIQHIINRLGITKQRLSLVKV